MNGEDKIFLLQAFHAVNGSEHSRRKWRESPENMARLVDIVDSCGREELYEQLGKIREMANEN
jgi:hypothetical protein